MIRGILVDVEGSPVDGYVTAGARGRMSRMLTPAELPSPWPSRTCSRFPEGLLGLRPRCVGHAGPAFPLEKGRPERRVGPLCWSLVREHHRARGGRSTDKPMIQCAVSTCRRQMLRRQLAAVADALRSIRPVVDDEGYLPVRSRVPIGLEGEGRSAHRGTLTGQSRRLQLTAG